MAFSAAIGNDDAHPGNYGLVIDDQDGRARLAPIFDVLPMIFAPRHDELPDEWVPERRVDEEPSVRPWIDRLANLVAGAEEISQPFRQRWLRWLGRPMD